MSSFFCLGKYLKEINIVMKNKINKKMAELELTSSQMEILNYLLVNQDKGINQRDLEKVFNLANSTVTGILNRLESKEFIVRTVGDSDARYKYISVTEKSLELKKEMQKHKTCIEEEFLKDISPEEIATMERIFQKILKNISD